MAVLPIKILPAPVLRQKAKKVPGMDNGLRKLVENMLDTMFDANGVGLAAPQVGVPLRGVTNLYAGR
jgi:peptide deformylase